MRQAWSVRGEWLHDLQVSCDRLANAALCSSVRFPAKDHARVPAFRPEGERGGKRPRTEPGTLGVGSMEGGYIASVRATTARSESASRSSRGQRVSALKPPPNRLDARPIRAEVPEGKPRSRADMNGPILRAQSTLQVVDKADPSSANRVKIVVGRGDNDSARHPRDEVLHSVESGNGIAGGGDRIDAMKRRCIPSTAYANGEPGTR